MRHKLTCPECKKAFPFSFMKNAFSSKMRCPNCNASLFIENRTFPYIIMAAILFLASDYIFAFFKSFHLSNILIYTLVLLTLLLLCVLLQIAMKYLLGAQFIYNIRAHDYYEQQKQQANQMNNEKKKHTSQKK